MTQNKSLLAVLLAFVLFLGACASSRQTTTGTLPDANGTGVRKTGSINKTGKGAIIGAGGGA
ncbi:MAG: hypothetical protein EOO36_24880, partial [Cytophagaceae bacterium]